MKGILLVAMLFISPMLGFCEEVTANDLNKDGKVDSWLYRDDKGVSLKWFRDTDFDGREDQWSFFKDGRAFLDEEDTNGDGKVDRIIITMWDPQNNQRTILLTQDDKSIFFLDEDTGWNGGKL